MDLCKAGDDVTVTGVVLQRWRPLMYVMCTSDFIVLCSNSMTCQLELVLLANHISLNSEQRVGVTVTEEQVSMSLVCAASIFLLFSDKCLF